MIRYNRIKHSLTQQEIADKLGFKTIYSYQRLENKKCNPTLKMLSRIKKVFPEFSVDFALGG
jgi:transcriptional regulator with XRE-family HTH domain